MEQNKNKISFENCCCWSNGH